MPNEEGRNFEGHYGRGEFNTSSKESLLPSPGAMSLLSGYSETSIRQIDKEDVLYVLQRLMQTVREDGLSSVNPYRIYDVPQPHPVIPERPRTKNIHRKLKPMLTTLLVLCIVLGVLLLCVIALALYFYLGSLGCALTEAAIQNDTLPRADRLTGNLSESDTDNYCCCDKCRGHFSTGFRDDGPNGQRNSLTTPDANKGHIDRSHSSRGDVCVFGSACARVGIGIPDELHHCAELEEHSYLPLNDSLENRERQNRKGIKIHNNSSMDIKTTGVYIVHSRLAYNPNCSKLCESSRNKNFVHKVLVYRIPDRRDNTKDQVVELLSIEHKCCTDCNGHSGISFVMGYFKLLKNDDVFIKTTGPELIKYSDVSSYLEVVLLKEGDEEP